MSAHLANQGNSLQAFQYDSLIMQQSIISGEIADQILIERIQDAIKMLNTGNVSSSEKLFSAIEQSISNKNMPHFHYITYKCLAECYNKFTTE
jgi:hypothetical protein